MEALLSLTVEYSAAISPLLSLWAIALLFLQPKDSDQSSAQAIYFMAMLVVSTLTVRATLTHDTFWLLNAASLGLLIVAGALRRPEDRAEPVASGY
jgi:hypothetical protein